MIASRAAAPRFPLDTPLIPDGEEAREWAEQELSDPAYRIAEPTPLDRIARAVGDFFAGLFDPEVSGAWGTTFALVAAVVVVVVIIAAFLVWGLPRGSARAAARTGVLFGDVEERSADELRRAAESCAGRAEWAEAVVLRFRAIARSCTERGVVDTPPGTTVHGFARAAGRVFPSSLDDLERAATAFDDVRYLHREGTPALYALVRAVDLAVSAASPTVTDAAVRS